MSHNDTESLNMSAPSDGIQRVPRTMMERDKTFRQVAGAIMALAVIALVFVVPLVLILTGESVQEETETHEGTETPTNHTTTIDDLWTNATTLTGEKYAVATDHPLCSQIGLQILADNGNAVDAAIASTLCLGIANPFASGVGGGGVMLLRLANGTSTIIDFREQAPAAANSTMFVNNTSLSQKGALSIAVPGELKGLEYASKKYGKLPWQRVMQPAISLATDGCPVFPLLASMLSNNEAVILKSPQLKAIFAPNGTVLGDGDSFTWPALAGFLKNVAVNGTAALYGANSTLAATIASEIRAAGGIITAQDFVSYQVKERTPIKSWFQGYEVITSPPPFGGAILTSTLNILERYNVAKMGFNNGQAVHYLVEALKWSYSNRLALGDPAFVDLSSILPTMTAKDHAALLRRNISANTTYPTSHYIDLAKGINIIDDHGTSHLSIVDGDRNVVSLTTTINMGFGSEFVSPSSGILFNDQMDDFSTPGASNAYGYPPSPANYIAPGKRPLSSMSPTIVTMDGKPRLVVGASGGSKIPTATINTLLNVLTWDRPVQDAVSRPRVHHQFIPTNLYVEEGYSESVLEALEARHHNVTVGSTTLGNVQAIFVNDNDTLVATSDWRKIGSPAAA